MLADLCLLEVFHFCELLVQLEECQRSWSPLQRGVGLAGGAELSPGEGLCEGSKSKIQSEAKLECNFKSCIL